jgi:hypothetical protein
MRLLQNSGRSTIRGAHLGIVKIKSLDIDDDDQKLSAEQRTIF